MAIVGVLGTLHGDDKFREEMGYTLETMKKAILGFMPDIICGEVRPEDWQKYCSDKSYSGYLGPNEYRRMIIPLCEEHNIKFEPVDWFEDDMVSWSYVRDYEKPQQEQFEKEIEERYKVIFEIGKKSALPLNSLQWNETIKEKQSWLEKFNPDMHNLTWIARNQIMVERIRKVVEGNKEKRILCTAGAEHNYFYYEGLKKLGYNVVYPLTID